MNEQNNIKLSHIFELPTLDFKSQMNIAIDSNANIKTIINVQPYLCDEEIDASNGKCTIKGKIGVKVLYIDTDNLFNTITNETPFTETIADSNLTSECEVFITNQQFSTSYDYDGTLLKLVINIELKTHTNINLNMTSPDTSNDNLIMKKEELQCLHSISKIHTDFSDSKKFLIDDVVSKVLSINISPTVSNIECNDNYITISGYYCIKIIYDSDNGDSCELKVFTDTSAFSIETPATSTTNSNCLIDLSIIENKTNFTTEIDENKTKLIIDFDVAIAGNIYETEQCQQISDIYSTKNEIEAIYSDREMCSISPITCNKTQIDGEIKLEENHSIDDIIEVVHSNGTITQAYIDQNKINFEGVLSACLTYYDEQREIKSMIVEMPFLVSYDSDNSDKCQIIDYKLCPLNCKAKLKRSNTLYLEIETYCQYYLVKKKSLKVLETLKISKQIEYGDIAFQIVSSRPNESMWDFCKRCHTCIDKIKGCNKNISDELTGQEKFLIYR